MNNGFQFLMNSEYQTPHPDPHGGSYMSAHVLLNLLNKLRKTIKYEACQHIIDFTQCV